MVHHTVVPASWLLNLIRFFNVGSGFTVLSPLLSEHLYNVALENAEAYKIEQTVPIQLLNAKKLQKQTLF